MNLFIIYNILIGLSINLVNSQTSNRNQDQWYKEEWPAQPYAFGYEIRDYSGMNRVHRFRHLIKTNEFIGEGNEQYRKEMSDGERVTGSYGYLGPDGLYRHVEYVADINGFRAKIRTTEPGTANDNPSNVQIEANPILVLPNPSPVVPVPVVPVVNRGSTYGDVSTNANPGQGFRRDGIRRPPDRPQINPNPNRSTFTDRPHVVSPPRIPDPPRVPDIPPVDNERTLNVDQFNVNRGPPPEEQPIKPDFEDPSLRTSPMDSTRGRPNGEPNGVTYADIPDNVIPYGGAHPRRPSPDDRPREVPRFNDPRQDQRGQGPVQRDDPGLNDGRHGDRRNGVRPPYAVRIPSRQPVRSSAKPHDEGSYDRSVIRGDRDGHDQDLNGMRGRPPPSPGHDIRDRPPPSPDSRRYEVTTNKGSTKLPPRDMGFIEATKGPVSPYRPENRFYDKPTPVFDDDNEYDDQFKRRQDDDRNIVMVNKPVFEDRDRDRDRDKNVPRKIGVFVRRYNQTKPDSRNGAKGQPSPPIRDSFNRTLNGSSYDANQGRRDGIDKRVRRPTKVFVTSGPISGIPDKRMPPIEGDNKFYRGIDGQQRQQHFDIDYDNKNTRDDQRINSDGLKGHTDRDRPLPPNQREEIPPQNIRPYFGARREESPESVPKRPLSETPPSRQPSPPYDPHDQQQYIQNADEDIPRQRDDEDQQPPRSGGPQVFQPLMPNHRPDRQPLPRRPEQRPYRPRTQSRDRSYEEQSIEVQPYQTQNSASITSPVNTIPTAYKPVDSLEDEKSPQEEEKPSFNTPLSPSSYIVTPFPVNETKNQIKPIIGRPDVYTISSGEYTPMEVPKFGTRLNTPLTQQIYESNDQNLADEKVDQQIDYNNEGSDEQNVNQNDYQNEDKNNNQNQSDKPIDYSVDGQNPNPQQFGNIEEDQYYAYYDDQTQDVDSKDSSQDVLFTQTAAHKIDQNLEINPNNSLPIEITHKVMNVINWHKYDSGGKPLNQK